MTLDDIGSTPHELNARDIILEFIMNAAEELGEKPGEARADETIDHFRVATYDHWFSLEDLWLEIEENYGLKTNSTDRAFVSGDQQRANDEGRDLPQNPTFEQLADYLHNLLKPCSIRAPGYLDQPPSVARALRWMEREARRSATANPPDYRVIGVARLERIADSRLNEMAFTPEMVVLDWLQGKRLEAFWHRCEWKSQYRLPPLNQGKRSFPIPMEVVSKKKARPLPWGLILLDVILLGFLCMNWPSNAVSHPLQIGIRALVGISAIAFIVVVTTKAIRRLFTLTLSGSGDSISFKKGASTSEVESSGFIAEASSSKEVSLPENIRTFKDIAKVIAGDTLA